MNHFTITIADEAPAPMIAEVLSYLAKQVKGFSEGSIADGNPNDFAETNWAVTIGLDPEMQAFFGSDLPCVGNLVTADGSGSFTSYLYWTAEGTITTSDDEINDWMKSL